MSRYQRVIVIGLDGLEPTIIDRLLPRGELPNLASLIRANRVARIATTYPAQTPVAWSTFATGLNPGGHGIFDFVARDPTRYLPTFALNTYERRNAFLPPRAVNLRGGETIWDVLTKNGIPSSVLRCPCEYPPSELKGRLLAGMGTPDLAGSLATPSFHSAQAPGAPRETEALSPLRPTGLAGEYSGQFLGPRHPRTRERVGVDFQLRVDAARRRALLTTKGTSGAIELREGEWGEWIKLRFPVGPLTTVRGMVRPLLVRSAPEPELYASPTNFDPDAPMFPISAPASYASDLEKEIGSFYTTGMVEDHVGLNNGRFDESVFLAQCEQVLRERERMLLWELERSKSGLIYCLFDTPDRLQHMFWRFTEPDHPANREAPASNEWRGTIEEHYRRCDQIVGNALAAADDRTLVLTLSDHGFGSFRRQVSLNAWLRSAGLLTYKEGQAPDPEKSESFLGVDWGRTQAYAVGLGAIYLNRRGREAEGIVTDEEAPVIKKRIQTELGNLVDLDHGQPAIRGVHDRDELYHGPYVDRSGDLLVGFAPGYRASWSTALGGLSEAVIEDNPKRWSGDHIIDPPAAPGFVAASAELDLESAGLIDMAPTILDALGIPKPDAMEGRSLLT